MWRKLVDDLVKIFNEDAFINLVIKERVESLKEEEKKLYTKILYGVVENKKWLDYLLKPYTTGKRFNYSWYYNRQADIRKAKLLFSYWGIQTII